MWLAQTYNYTVDPDLTTTSTAGFALFGAGLFTLILLALVPYVIYVIAMWKVFVKAGQPGWAAIIPIYNIYILLQIVGRPTWWLLIFILMFIPFVNFIAWIPAIVLAIFVQLDLAKAFGKDATFAWLLLIIFSFIGMLILGFGNDKYLGAPHKLS